ncbi:hypothetical protein HMP06_2056 [Sphingomonas sp. HMP6]|nr:hypothetical protein HMP06_2056 [Sphingomonas sp. HMP6]
MLKRRDRPACGGGRDSQPPRRLGETNLVGDRHKGPQHIQPIHNYPDLRKSDMSNDRIITGWQIAHSYCAGGIQRPAPENAPCPA